MAKGFLIQSVLKIPNNVVIKIKNKTVLIKGIKGRNKKTFKVKGVSFILKKFSYRELFIRCYYQNKKEFSKVRTICSHIYNMILGVTKGFEYKMRLVYAHFPINVMFYKEKGVLEIKNYFGSKRIDLFFIPSIIDVLVSDSQKKELSFLSKDIELLGTFTGIINKTCSINDKDSRIFLDGIYNSEKNITQ